MINSVCNVSYNQTTLQHMVLIWQLQMYCLPMLSVLDLVRVLDRIVEGVKSQCAQRRFKLLIGAYCSYFPIWSPHFKLEWISNLRIVTTSERFSLFAFKTVAVEYVYILRSWEVCISLRFFDQFEIWYQNVCNGLNDLQPYNSNIFYILPFTHKTNTDLSPKIYYFIVLLFFFNWPDKRLFWSMVYQKSNDLQLCNEIFFFLLYISLTNWVQTKFHIIRAVPKSLLQ